MRPPAPRSECLRDPSLGGRGPAGKVKASPAEPCRRPSPAAVACPRHPTGPRRPGTRRDRGARQAWSAPTFIPWRRPRRPRSSSSRTGASPTSSLRILLRVGALLDPEDDQGEREPYLGPLRHWQKVAVAIAHREILGWLGSRVLNRLSWLGRMRTDFVSGLGADGVQGRSSLAILTSWPLIFTPSTRCQSATSIFSQGMNRRRVCPLKGMM